MYTAFEITGYPGPLETVSSEDTAKGLAASTRRRDSGNPAVALTITIEGAAIRVRWDGDGPTQTDGHLFSGGSSLRMANPAAIRNFRFVSAVLGAPATLQVSPEFNAPAE